MISTKKLIYKIVQNLEGIPTKISNAVTALSNELSPQITSLDSRVTSLSSSVSTTDSNVSALTSRVSSLEAYHNLSSHVGSNIYNASISIYKQGNLVWVHYRGITTGIAAGNSVALFGIYQDVRPYTESVNSIQIVDGNYKPIAMATVSIGTDGWCYITPATGVDTSHIIFEAIYIV